MGKFDEEIHDEEQGNDILDRVAAAAPLQAKGAALQPVIKESLGKKMVSQVIVRNVPQEWADKIKAQGYTTMTGYIRVALKEKLERDGLI